MSNGAKLIGVEQLLVNMERQLGEAKVNRVVNKALKETAKEIELDFKKELEVYRDTGETLDSVTTSGVTRSSGEAVVKIGFGAGSRWRLVHLNELGYAKNPHPRGFGVIRRFSENLETEYPEKIREKVGNSFGR